MTTTPIQTSGKTQRFYRPELDALRFFAFLCVFSSHLPVYRPWFEPIRGMGGFGTCIFFLLSAYLIVTILLREKEKTGTIGLRAFAMRRILRIWPLYFFVLFADYLIGLHWPSVHIPGHAVVAFSLLAGNLYIASYGWIADTVNALWSLSVEEQFYLAVPTCARLGGRRALAAICSVTICVSFMTLAYLGHRGVIAIIGVWANSFVQFQFFAAGGLIALSLYDRKFDLVLPLRLILAMVGSVLWYTAATRFQLHSSSATTAPQLILGYLCLLIGTVLLFLSLLDIGVRMPAVVIYLGKISYGLYLFHQVWLWLFLRPAFETPLFLLIARHKFVGTFLALVATILTSIISYHYFESPILKFKHRFETVRTRPD